MQSTTSHPDVPSIPRLWPTLVAILLVALGNLTALGSSPTPRSVPYVGDVVGTVVCDFFLQDPTASAVVTSQPLGDGVQSFEDLSLTVFADGGATFLETGGIAVTTTASGRELRIRFLLHGVFVSPTTVVYTGEFIVLPGGTGPFSYRCATGELGSGVIEGTAEVVPDFATGQLIFRFEHHFSGRLLLGKRGGSDTRGGEDEDEDEDRDDGDRSRRKHDRYAGENGFRED